MDANELRELAASLESLLAPSAMAASDYLRACADALDAGPVAWTDLDTFEWSRKNWMGNNWIPLYPVAMPAQPSSNPCQLPEPPHECKTEDEKRAFAFGWWKAMEVAAAPTPPAQDDEALEVLRQAAQALDEAADSIADWASYASDYFRAKHDFDGDLKRTRDAAAHFRALLAKRGAA